MPAKKTIGFRKAEQVRRGLIFALETCNSVNKFIFIEKAHEHKKRVLKLFDVNSQLKKRNRDLLARRDEQIAMLFKEKRQQFAPQLTQLVEQHYLKEEQEKQEELVQKQSSFIDNDVYEPIEDSEASDNAKLSSVITPAENLKPQLNLQKINDLKDVKKQLLLLSGKGLEFEGKIKALQEQQPVDAQKLADYTKAKTAIDSIYKGINGLYENYIYGRINLAEFKKDTKFYLNEENEHVQTLQSHRGVKEILLNLLAVIAGLVIFYGIAAAVKGRFLVFKPATDSGSKLSNLGQTIENTTAASVA